MSTRSGKRIHSSFHENSVKTETEITRSERKTRSKLTKENVDVLNTNQKANTRHYVKYPTSDEDPSNAAADEYREDKKKTRVLRKNALKERNVTIESAEPDARKSIRCTRQTRKFTENTKDSDNLSQDEPKTKKSKKMEKKVTAPKKKSKRKNSRSSGSIIVEDIIVPEAPSALNRSNNSVDSFYSAAGSPKKTDCDEPSSIHPGSPNTTEKKIGFQEVRKTRSAANPDHTLTNYDTTDKRLDRKSTLKANSSVKKDADLLDMSRNLRRRKSTINVTEECQNATLEIDVSSNTRKSLKNAIFDETVTPNKVDTSKMETVTTGKKRKSLKNETIDINDDLKATEGTPINITFDIDADINSGKNGRRQSALIAVVKDTEMSSSVVVVGKTKQDTTLLYNTKEDSEVTEENEESNKNVSLRKSNIDTTYDKDSDDTESVKNKMSFVNNTFDVASSDKEVSSPIKMDDNDLKRKSVINTTYDKETDEETNVNVTFDKVTVTNNTTFDKETEIEDARKSLPPLRQNLLDIHLAEEKEFDTTLNKNSTSSIISTDNSIITLDKSNSLQTSITSDESQNILNTTPVLIESSFEKSIISLERTSFKTDSIVPVTPLKREGTFTKDSSADESNKSPEGASPKTVTAPMTPKREGTFTKDDSFDPTTPTKRNSYPTPGFTPYHVNKSATKEKRVLMNVTRSIERSRRSSLAEPLRATKVMFCSPVNNPALAIQNEKKVIKSNLKGSNKSFIFDRSISLESRAGRKRSFTQGDAPESRVKRSRLAGGGARPAGGQLARAAAGATAKQSEPTILKKLPTPRKSEGKPSRTKLPNFAALHQRQFDQMESLDECQTRRARRAKLLLTPTGGTDVLRVSPRDKEQDKTTQPSEPSNDAKKQDTPIKSLPPLKSLNAGYTRFGFKLNLDVNPFSIPSKTQTQPKEKKPINPAVSKGIKIKNSLPSLSGATSRKEIAKQTVLREKSFTDRRSVKRTENLNENRTVIKGVRTNRRFELQMRMRDL